MFDSQQDSYISFRNIISERTRRVIIWAGSGLSRPAGLPSWSELRETLYKTLDNKINHLLDGPEKKVLIGKYKTLENIRDLWTAFQILKESLGQATYQSKIRELFQVADKCQIPGNYNLLWSLPLDGIFNLNLDRLATRAHSDKFPGHMLTEFSGKQAANFIHILKGTTPFIVNLHGTVADESSWIFTRDDISRLLHNTGYLRFIQSCLCTRTILFLGITADDIAVRQHFEQMKRYDIDFGEHYWITDRNDYNTSAWAEKAGIRTICYSSENDHSDLKEFFAGLLSYIPQEMTAPPVEMQAVSIENKELPDPDELCKKSNEEIRKLLNEHASIILKDRTERAYQNYSDFCRKYDQSIYRAWYITNSAPHNIIFGYELLEEIAEGAFGRVYRAKGKEGNDVAIKILKEDVRRKPDMLQSFRRGVHSMRILSNHKVEGMVPYHEASEIPAIAVMDMIEGPNLGEAVESQYCTEWDVVLKIAVQLSRIIKTAHQLPERVLHRDIRPANIMLKNYYSEPEDWKVVVLDFDLSWHLGALEMSIVDRSSVNGYLAPEQVKRRSRESTRNAAVDSFGIGMTLYFLRSSKEPLYLQHKHYDWKDELNEFIKRYPCLKWHSIPFRYARLILFSTLDKQSDRWDMSQIEGELEQLYDAYSNPNSVCSAELMTEEVAARTAIALGQIYEWDNDRKRAKICLPSGVLLSMIPFESNHTIEIAFSWSNEHLNREHKEIRKYLNVKCDQVISNLKKCGCYTQSPSYSVDHMEFCASLGLNVLRGNIDKVSTVLTESLNILSFS